MNSKNTILTLATALIVASGASAQTPSENPPPRLTKEEREAFRAEHEQIVAIYDEDGDGKLDAVEREVLFEDIQNGVIDPPGRGFGRHGPPPEIVDQYDIDGDGELSVEEREALRADVEAGNIELPKPEGRGKGGRGREGPPQEIIAQFDVDGDGRLSQEEHEAVRAAIEAGEIDPPARRPHRRGRGSAAEEEN